MQKILSKKNIKIMGCLCSIVEHCKGEDDDAGGIGKTAIRRNDEKDKIF